MPYDSIIDEIIRKEGGYVDNPNDKGGPTKYGITLDTLSNWRGKTCTIRDIQDLTVVEAKEIYLSKYIYKPCFDKLPDQIRAQVIDIGVNSGVGTSAILLVRACLKVNPEVAIKETSKLTSKELAYIKETVDDYGFVKVMNTLVDARLVYLAKITRNNPKNAEFIMGWVIRALSFRV